MLARYSCWRYIYSYDLGRPVRVSGGPRSMAYHATPRRYSVCRWAFSELPLFRFRDVNTLSKCTYFVIAVRARLMRTTLFALPIRNTSIHTCTY
jgi:hypothetical protein